MPATSSSLRNTGVAYSLGYNGRCDSRARRSCSLASESGTVLIQVIDGGAGYETMAPRRTSRKALCVARWIHVPWLYPILASCLAAEDLIMSHHQYRMEALIRKNPSMAPRTNVDNNPARARRA